MFLFIFLLHLVILFPISILFNYFFYPRVFKENIKFKRLILKSWLPSLLWIVLLSSIPFSLPVISKSIILVVPLFLFSFISIVLNYSQINNIKPIHFKKNIFYTLPFYFHAIISLLIIFLWFVQFVAASIGG